MPSFRTPRAGKSCTPDWNAVGLRFARKGSGAVIFVGDTAVKASSVDRNFSMSRLCKRLGAFKPGFYSPRTFKKPAPEPVSHVCREEWQESQQKRQRLAEERRLAEKKREEGWEELEQSQRERRDAAIALYMRCAGYTPQEVANEVFRHTLARPTDRTVTNGESTGAGWSDTPSGQQEILILPMYSLRRRRFGSWTGRPRKWNGNG